MICPHCGKGKLENERVRKIVAYNRATYTCSHCGQNVREIRLIPNPQCTSVHLYQALMAKWVLSTEGKPYALRWPFFIKRLDQLLIENK